MTNWRTARCAELCDPGQMAYVEAAGVVTLATYTATPAGNVWIKHGGVNVIDDVRWVHPCEKPAPPVSIPPKPPVDYGGLLAALKSMDSTAYAMSMAIKRIAAEIGTEPPPTALLAMTWARELIGENIALVREHDGWRASAMVGTGWQRDPWRAVVTLVLMVLRDKARHADR